MLGSVSEEQINTNLSILTTTYSATDQCQRSNILANANPSGDAFGAHRKLTCRRHHPTPAFSPKAATRAANFWALSARQTSSIELMSALFWRQIANLGAAGPTRSLLLELAVARYS